MFAAAVAAMIVANTPLEPTGVNLLFDERLGIIVGSLCSGLAGYLVLRKAL